jgi:hypothetical protein
MQPKCWDLSPAGDPQLTITADDDGSSVVMAVHGNWDRRLFLRVRRVVHRCLSDYPAALIVDLDELDDPEGASALLWLTARSTGEAMRPGVRLVLCLEPDTMLAARLQRLGARWFMPVFDDAAHARAALISRPVLTDYSRLRLAPEPTSPSMARMLVADACRAWALPDLLSAGQLVASELVTNAVEHARTELLVNLARRGRGLYLAVRDGNLDPPRLRVRTPAQAGNDEHGRGLRMVDHLAIAWGALPTHDGTGKVVWASIQSPASATVNGGRQGADLAPRRRYVI